MDPADLLVRLWAEGAASDDRQAIALARESATGRTADELSLWWAWIGTDDGLGTGVDESVVDRVAGDPATSLVILAVELRAATLRRDHAALDEALLGIDHAIGRTPRDDRGQTAHAAADFALAEAALYARDLPAARRFLDPLLVSAPTAIRIAALMRSATLGLAGGNARDAQKRARQALTLARSTARTRQGNQAQLLLGLVSYTAGDPETMRATLEPLVAAAPNDSFTRFLLAGLEGGDRAIELLGEGLGAAARGGDALAFTLCALAGARRYVAAGKRPDALVVMSSARVQLAKHAPELSAVLDAELHGWRDAWGATEFAQTERDAIALLDAD